MRYSNLFREFVNSEKAGGLVLIICTAVSLIIANSGIGPMYTSFWNQSINIPGDFHFDMTIRSWINDGLMTIFFLLVGLEIEREIYAGELRSWKAASLPVAGALGGMIVPALIYSYFNHNGPAASGYGIPMATDIAFALGVLTIAGKRVPHGLKVFLTALAIIDDLGAIIVIAVFYNTGISWMDLGISMLLFAGLLGMNRLGVNRLAFYIVPGIFMWYFMHRSGVHGTLAGVLLAFAIPFRNNDETNISYSLQHFLHKPVAFLILPLFAIANTAIVLPYHWYFNLSSPHSIGIVAGLVAGKPLGILTFCFLVCRIGLSRLPLNINWWQLAGVAILGGIGFTMSIFISNLAFTDTGFITFSRIAVLVASAVAALIGLVFLAVVLARRTNSSD